MNAAGDLGLAAYLDRVRACRLCRDRPVSAPPLPHEPRPVVRAASGARILICGQAPGTRVHASGKPFTDPSGDRLRAWLGVDEAAFYDTSLFAIVPMGFCFPGQDERGSDLPPRKECAPAWQDGVLGRLPNVELMLLVGSYAQRWHLGADVRRTLTATVADWRTYVAKEGRPTRMPLPHPSWRNIGWLKRNPWFCNELLPDLRDRIARIRDRS